MKGLGKLLLASWQLVANRIELASASFLKKLFAGRRPAGEFRLNLRNDRRA
jgi:hypothetical protein